MKKRSVSLILNILLMVILALSACSDNKNRTYYPSADEMKDNLKKNGYQTELSIGERTPEGDGYVSDSITATNGDDYICFYWIENAAHCKVYYNKLQELYPDCPVIVLIENDETFGNIVYCGTTNAINAAGIIAVKIDVIVEVANPLFATL